MPQEPLGHRKKKSLTFADFLKSRRAQLGLNRTEMARKLEISRTQLTRLETGENKQPSIALLARIVQTKEFDARPEDLYALTGCMPPTALPKFIPYLRAIHPDWSDDEIAMLDLFHDFLRYRNSLS